MKKPLEGLRIVEYCVWVAGPGSGMILADLGAEVIKVEDMRGDGDPYRRIGSGMGVPIKGDTGTDMNPWFDATNYNKQFVCLDTRTEEGMQVFYDLLSTADCFVTSMRQQMLAKRGLDYDTLHQKFPRLPYAHFLGYGERGPWKDRPGFDGTTFFAQGGVFGNSAPEGGDYLGNFPVAFADAWSGGYMALCATVGIIESMLHGTGDYINTSLYAEAFWSQRLSLLQYQFGVPYPVDTRKPSAPTLNSYRTKDGRWMYLCVSDYNRYYNDIVRGIGRDDLVDDPVLSKQDAMVAAGRQQELADILAKGFAEHTSAEIHAAMDPCEVPVEDCIMYDEVLESEQAWANGFLESITYPTGDETIAIAQPITARNMGGHSFGRGKPLGADNDRYLSELGYSAEEVAHLREKGIVA